MHCCAKCISRLGNLALTRDLDTEEGVKDGGVRVLQGDLKNLIVHSAVGIDHVCQKVEARVRHGTVVAEYHVRRLERITVLELRISKLDRVDKLIVADLNILCKCWIITAGTFVNTVEALKDVAVGHLHVDQMGGLCPVRGLERGGSTQH